MNWCHCWSPVHPLRPQNSGGLAEVLSEWKPSKATSLTEVIKSSGCPSLKHFVKLLSCFDQIDRFSYLLTFNDELVDQLLLDDVARFEAGNETESGGWWGDAFAPARESSLSSSKSCTLVPPGVPPLPPQSPPRSTPQLFPSNSRVATSCGGVVRMREWGTQSFGRMGGIVGGFTLGEGGLPILSHNSSGSSHTPKDWQGKVQIAFMSPIIWLLLVYRSFYCVTLLQNTGKWIWWQGGWKLLRWRKLSTIVNIRMGLRVEGIEYTSKQQLGHCLTQITPGVSSRTECGEATSHKNSFKRAQYGGTIWGQDIKLTKAGGHNVNKKSVKTPSKDYAARLLNHMFSKRAIWISIQSQSQNHTTLIASQVCSACVVCWKITCSKNR